MYIYGYGTVELEENGFMRNFDITKCTIVDEGWAEKVMSYINHDEYIPNPLLYLCKIITINSRTIWIQYGDLRGLLSLGWQYFNISAIEIKGYKTLGVWVSPELLSIVSNEWFADKSNGDAILEYERSFDLLFL